MGNFKIKNCNRSYVKIRCNHFQILKKKRKKNIFISFNLTIKFIHLNILHVNRLHTIFFFTNSLIIWRINLSFVKKLNNQI
jgi:hypothetical protein